MEFGLVAWLESLMTRFGAGWVLWLLFALSVFSLAIMLERGWLYWSLRDDIPRLAADLRELLRKSNVDGARKRLEDSPSAEAAVVVAGLAEVDSGSAAAEQAMEGASALQRMKLERRLAYLGTLGNNAPFIGLFGTVIGVVQAFQALGAGTDDNAGGNQLLMAAIGEALVATAVGIAVAIPAVATYNFFMRYSKGIRANTSALSSVLLAHMAAEDHESNSIKPEGD